MPTATSSSPPKSFTDVVDELSALADDNSTVPVREVTSLFGSRFAAPIMIICGVVILVPITGAIPGVPTVASGIVVLTVIQMLASRRRVWIPKWLGEREIDAERIQKAARKVKPAGRWIDRISRRRLTWLVDHVGTYLIAVLSILIAAATPALEVIPYSAAIAGAAYVCFGVALLAHDGLLALAAIACSATLLVLVGMQLF